MDGSILSAAAIKGDTVLASDTSRSLVSPSEQEASAILASFPDLVRIIKSGELRYTLSSTFSSTT